MVSAMPPTAVADRAASNSAAPPSPPTSPTSPKPPGGPPSGKRPVAHLAAAVEGYARPPAGGAGAEAASAPPKPPAAAANPYGLSEEALLRKQRFDRERAHSNSAVRAVRHTHSLSLCLFFTHI